MVSMGSRDLGAEGSPVVVIRIRGDGVHSRTTHAGFPLASQSV